MEQIVYSGTKLNIDYWIDEILDEDQQEEIHDYFLEAETDNLEEAMKEFDGDYEDEELRLYRLKFISEVANKIWPPRFGFLATDKFISYDALYIC